MMATTRRSLWRQAVRRCLAATLPRRWLLTRGPRRCNSVCLTFDDGPDPTHTEAILNILRQEGVPATFFVVGRQVEKYPNIVRRIVAENHELGHHTYSHGEPARTSATALLAEVRRTQAALKRITGAPSMLFRPPHGKVTALKLWRLWRNGQTVALWNVDPSDYRCQSAEDLRRWFEARPLRGGDVVLLHDNQPHAAGVLTELIRDARRRGLSFATPRQWLK